MDLRKVFGKFDDEYLQFEPKNVRPDLRAFVILDKLLPAEAGRNIIEGAEYGVIFLNIGCKQLAEVASEDDIRELVRFGVMYNWAEESLEMRV